MPAIRELLSRFVTDEYLPAGRIGKAELYWVSSDMTALAVQVAKGLPEWTPGQAAPAPTGLLLWDGPGTPEVPVYTLPRRVERTNIYGQVMTTWAPLAGLLWAVTEVEVRGVALVRTQSLPAEAGQAVADRFPVVAPACTLPLMLTQRATNPDSYHQDVRSLMRLVGTTWLLMGQATLTTAQTLDPGRSPHGNRKEPAGPAVSIIELRRAHPTEDSQDGQPDVTSPYHHRWLVSPHWRSQPYGPRGSLRRPVLVAAHIKGPPGAPMLETERVHIWRR